MTTSRRAATGVAGLDDVLGGGLPCDRLYLLQGTPGVGKTTLALQFLMEGRKLGERTLYVTLSETRDEIEQVAESHGWSLDGIDVYELSSAEQTLHLEENTLYATADIELKETVRVLLAEVERVNPARVVFDSLAEVRLLAQTPVRYRRQLLGLKQYFATRRATVLLLDDRSGDQADTQVESLAHGVIALEQMPVHYGADRRRMRVVKLRGAVSRSGWHDFAVRTGGVVVFPRLVAAEHRSDFVAESISSGVAGLDRLLGGGIDRGTTTLVMGPAGAGKSAVVTQVAAAAAKRGEHAALFLFDERPGTLRVRARALGIPLDEAEKAKAISLHQVDPAELAPDEFAHLVRRAVEVEGARIVVIDSLNGYFQSMPESRHLLLQMHELLSYLGARGVATLMTLAQSGVAGTMTSPVDVSYLADGVVLLRYYEAEGRVHKAISALKKRSGLHEDALRELLLGNGKLDVGEPLVQFRGILTGVPELVGRTSPKPAAKMGGGDDPGS